MLFDKRMVWFSAYTITLFIKSYQKITYKDDLKSHKALGSWDDMLFCLVFGSDVIIIIENLGVISFFHQSAYHDWLTKEHISKWSLVINTKLDPKWLKNIVS